MTGVHLVGGAVRDLLLGRPPSELDVVVEGDITPLAGRLGAGEDAVAHERFATATVRVGGCRWDLASARAETYARPGALPDVRAATLAEDLRRRDVTINALALDLADGTLRSAPHAEEDLQARRLRVLHDASFTDDPTRLWRVARYAARLGFAIEQRTAELAAEAVAGGALETVSGPRIGNELRLALAEPDPVAALDAAVAIGAAPWLAPDRALTERAIGLLAPGEGRRDLLVLAAALPAPADDALLARLEFTAAERAIVRASVAAPALKPRRTAPPPAPRRRSPAPCATCPSRRSRWPAHAARQRPRAAGWTSCAMSRCRSPAPTCWRPASRRARTSAGACRPCSTSASTVRSHPAARPSCRPRCRPRRARAHRDAVLQMS